MQRPAASRDPHVEADLDTLNSDFPDWRVWLSDEGHWYATRWKEVAPAAGARFGRVRMVDGPDAVRLLAELCDQTARDEQARQGPGTP
jgi:hypothetical protein